MSTTAVWQDVVSISETPSVPRPRSNALASLKSRADRRVVLKAIGFSMLAVGGSVLGLGPKWALPRASAETSPDGNWHGWDDCGNYGDGSAVDYTEQLDTSGIYSMNNWPGACHNGNPGNLISHSYCNSDNWHKKLTETGTGFTADYDRETRCWTIGAANVKNAWQWNTKAGGGHPVTRFRCSDGRVTICEGGSCNTSKTACRGTV